MKCYGQFLKWIMHGLQKFFLNKNHKGIFDIPWTGQNGHVIKNVVPQTAPTSKIETNFSKYASQLEFSMDAFCEEQHMRFSLQSAKTCAKSFEKSLEKYGWKTCFDVPDFVCC